MTKLILTILITLAVSTLLRQRACAQDAPSADAVRKALQQCVEVQHRAPGMVVGIITKDGATIFARGKCDDDKSADVNGDTLFEIGSITKVFTSLLLQDMADQGEVDLDEAITSYLPDSVKVPSRNGKSITLRNLATHTSGLPRLPTNLSPKDSDNPYADYTVAQLYEFLSNYHLPRDPGAKSEYSNLGVGLLGHVLTLRAGTNYEALVVSRICDPLKLDSTRITLTPELQARYATGHDASESPVSNWDIPTLAGAGALRSSANDLLKLLAAEMGFTPSPLSGAMQKTQKPQKGTGFLSRVGLGWQIDTLGGILWHNGGTGGYRSYMGFNENKTLGVVVLANSANDVDDIGKYLLGDLDSVADFTAPKHYAAVKIDYGIYDKYLGQYQLAPRAIITVTREGNRLFVQLTGQSAFEVFPTSPTDFFLKVVDAQITFETDDSGKAMDLILHQNGIDQKARKIN